MNKFKLRKLPIFGSFLIALFISSPAQALNCAKAPTQCRLFCQAVNNAVNHMNAMCLTEYDDLCDAAKYAFEQSSDRFAQCMARLLDEQKLQIAPFSELVAD